jgi:hypothetical protein
MKGMPYLVKMHLDKARDFVLFNFEVKIIAPELSLSPTEYEIFEVDG